MSTFEDVGDISYDEPTSPEAEAPTFVEDSGQGGAEDTQAPEVNYFDPSEHADKVVKVKVDGEEVDVPVSDLVQGYSRQQDYTKKTQDLAEQRKQLEAAQAIWERLNANPAEAIEGLIDYYQLGGQQPDPAEQFGFTEDTPEWARELAYRQAEQDQQLAAFRQWQSNQILQSQVQAMQARYAEFDPEFDARAAAAYAHRYNIPNIDLAYKAMAFDKQLARQQAEKAHQTASQAADAQVQAAAAAATQLVSRGGSAAGGGKPMVGSPQTPAEAYEMALKGLEVEDDFGF